MNEPRPIATVAGLNSLLAFLVEEAGGTLTIDSALYDAWALRQYGEIEPRIVVGVNLDGHTILTTAALSETSLKETM